MREKVKKYMDKCNLCHKIKSLRYKPYGEMRQALTPDQLWASVVMDFIVKLPPLKESLTGVFYDLILMIVD